MKEEIKIGIFQFNILWNNILENQRIVESKIKALTTVPDVIVLPEMYTTGFYDKPEDIELRMLTEQADWQAGISSLYGVHVMGTTIHMENGRYYNRFLHTTPQKEHYYYDKRHLFLGEEKLNYVQGTSRQIFSIDSYKIMPQICYDLRFPVWSRNDTGYHLLIYSSNWPLNRKLVWDTLLPARAIENQCYVIGVNRTGIDNNKIEYFGGSSVYNFKGEKMVYLNSAEQYAEVILPMKDLMDFRESFPVLKDADRFEIKNRE
jgi:predicted amidohydrolase